MAVRVGLLATTAGRSTKAATGYDDVLRLILAQPILLATTLMYLAFNLGGGAMLVWLPLWAESIPRGGSEIYGQLLGLMALGQLVSASATGFLPASAPKEG
jgi:hypothetical protein